MTQRVKRTVSQKTPYPFPLSPANWLNEPLGGNSVLPVNWLNELLGGNSVLPANWRNELLGGNSVLPANWLNELLGGILSLSVVTSELAQ